MIPSIDAVLYASDSAAASFARGTLAHRLSRDEVRLLATRIADGDREARNVLVQANLGLVVRVARHYVGRGLMMEDLVGEGNLGLIRAAEHFDPQVGTHFSTYATYWIKESILRALMNTAATIRLPAHMFRLLIQWSRTERSLGRAFGRAPSTEEIAEAMGLNEHQRDLLAKARHARGLRLESGLSLGPRLRWAARMMDSQATPEAHLEADDERNCLLERMRHLGNRERTVLILRYGLGSEPSMNYNEIGGRLGVTREWARKIAKQAIEKLVRGGPVDHARPFGGRPTDEFQSSTAPLHRPDPSESSARRDQPVAGPCAVATRGSSEDCSVRSCPAAGSRTRKTCRLARCG
jgi:RNA polymerase primary sigma factor